MTSTAPHKQTASRGTRALPREELVGKVPDMTDTDRTDRVEAPASITYNPVYDMTYKGADPTRGYVYHRADVDRWSQGLEDADGNELVTVRADDPRLAALSGAGGEGMPIPAGMKPWVGGDRAPADWDGASIYCRDGNLFTISLRADDHRWKHLGWGSDIIAYTPATHPGDHPGDAKAVAAPFDCDLCEDFMSRACPRCNPGALSPTSAPAGDGARS